MQTRKAVTKTLTYAIKTHFTLHANSLSIFVHLIFPLIFPASSMDSQPSVAVRARLTLVPAKPTIPGKVHDISLLDHLFQLHFVRSIYYFPSSAFSNRSRLLNHLKESLCRTLNLYPCFAGRLRKRDDGMWEIKCNDSGIRIYEASTELSFGDWPESEICPAEKDLTTVEIIPDYTLSPVAIVQLTDFKCGGLAIGFSWLHALGDPSCGTLFMKAWGEMHRAAQIIHPPFFHPPALKPRSILKTNTESVSYYASTFRSKHLEEGDSEFPTNKLETVMFRFSHNSVEKCISEVKNGEFRFGPVAPFEALFALLWVSLTKAQALTNTEASKLSLCLEFRKIHLPPLPHGYFGNAMHFVGVNSTVSDLTSKDLSYAASLINESNIMTDTEDIRAVIDWLQECQNDGESLCTKPGLLYGSELTCCAWDNFFSYDVIFDVEKPSHVAYDLQPLQSKGILQVLPSPEGNLARNVQLTLPSEQIRLLREDPLFLKFLSDN